MSKAYLRGTIIVLVGAVLVVWCTPTLLFRPLEHAVSNLTSGANHTQTTASAVSGTIACVAGLVLSFAAFVLTLRGLVRDYRSRLLVWTLMLVVAVLVLVQAAGLAWVAPKFRVLYKDLGI